MTVFTGSVAVAANVFLAIFTFTSFTNEFLAEHTETIAITFPTVKTIIVFAISA